MTGGVFSGGPRPRLDSTELGLAQAAVVVLCSAGPDVPPVHAALADAGFLVVPVPDANALGTLPAPPPFAVVETGSPGALDLLRSMTARNRTLAVAVLGPDEPDHHALAAGAIATLRRPIDKDDLLDHLRRFRAHHEQRSMQRESLERAHANAGVPMLERALAGVAHDMGPRLETTWRLLQTLAAARRAATPGADPGEIALIEGALRSVEEMRARLSTLAELAAGDPPWVEPVDLTAIAARAISTSSASKRAPIHLEGEPEVRAWADRERLEAVVVDLLGLALDQAIRVHVYSTLAEARISIDLAANTDELALTRARHAIARMGGALTGPAEDGTIRIHLRSGRAFVGTVEASGKTRRPVTQRGIPRVSRPPSAARHVLVVEDDNDTRASIADALAENGYEVTTAANGKEALETLAERLSDGPMPNVILVDLMMPVMTGWELLAALKEEKRLAEIPVVVFSAMTERRPTVARFVSKPMRLDTLLEAVRSACENGRRN